MFGGGRRYGAQPRDPFEDMMDHVFGGSFFGPPFQQQFGGGGIFDDLSRSGTSFGMDPFFADPFFRPPFLQQQQQQQYQQRSAPPQGRQGATVEEVPHGEEDWPASNHQPLVEEPDDAGDEGQPQSRAGAGASSRGGELLPRSRGDALSDSWLGGGGGGAFSTMQQSSFGPGGGYSKSTTTRRGPGGTVEVEEVTQDGDVHSVKTTHRIGDKGRTTVRTTDATGVEETRETLHGLTKSEAQAFDAEWAKRGGPGNPGPAEQQRRRPGWLRLPGFGGGGGGASHRDGGAGGGGGSAGASGGGGRNITIA